MFEKITEAEINERSMANVSTTPNRPTAFGESRMDAQALKLRFDRLGRYLAGRINEIFAGISDGNLAKTVKIVEEKGEETIEYSLAEFILKMIEGDLTQINVKVPEGTQRLDVICNQVLRWQNEIKTGDFADETVVVQGVTIRQFYEEFKKLEETGQGKPGEPGKSAYDYAVEGGYQGTEEEFAKKLATEYPSKVSQLENDEEYITALGAPVQTVNGKAGNVSLSAADVGARPNTWMPSYSDVNADKAGTAQSLVSGHNTSTDSHNDIRLELQRLAGIIADVLDSDDTTLDEMHEIVAVIKANTTIIEAITTGKVNVSDIIDNLTTNVKDKPLSAAQGVALKALIDALTTGKLDATELSNAINTALAQAKASGEFDGADGKTPYIQNGYWYIDGVNTSVKAQGNDGKGISSVAKTSTSGLVDTYTITFTDYTKTTFSVKNGRDGIDGIDGADYILNDSDKAEIAEKVNGATLVYSPKIVASTDEMSDTNKCYVLESTKTLWTNYYKEETTEKKQVKVDVVATTDNPATDGYQLGSDGATGTANSSATVSPYINIGQYDGQTITLYFSRLQWIHENTADKKYRVSLYDSTQTHIATYFSTQGGSNYWKEIQQNSTINSDGTATLTLEIPRTVNSKEVHYLRFGSVGTWTDGDIKVEYWGEVIIPGGWYWRDTNIAYPPIPTEVTNITDFSLVNPHVQEFIDTDDYPDDNYDETYVKDLSGSYFYRKDLPVPVVVRWEKDDDVVQYTVTINHLDEKILNTGMQIYYSNKNNILIYNLLPNTTYHYQVWGLLADSKIKNLKNGSFTTIAGRPRMLHIEGIQNVRDIGGYTGNDGKTVKYGKLFRGSAMDEDAYMSLSITGEGKEELTRRVGVRTDLDLRGEVSKSAILNDADYFYLKDANGNRTSYESYDNAITSSTHRGYFKTILEYIVTRLENNRPVYIHCQGGCDRTGTLVFLLLGLLGVSESDLAKEYELSSFSAIGHKSRTRNSTTYNYSGMVTKIKEYSGTTITDKFKAFAVACGIAEATIDSFRSLMLE